MAELIDKGALAELFEEKMFNSEVMCPVIKITDVLEIVEEQPTVTEAEIRAKAIEDTIDKAYLKLHRLLVNKMFEFNLSPMEIDRICNEIAEQLKGE